MGSRNPDRIPLSMRRSKCETVRQMIEQRWQVQAWCQTCRLKLRVDLRTVAIVRGPAYSLWNRRSRCKRVDCGGLVDFYAMAPGMSWLERLATPNAPQPDDVTPGWLRHLPKA